MKDQIDLQAETRGTLKKNPTQQLNVIGSLERLHGVESFMLGK